MTPSWLTGFRRTAADTGMSVLTTVCIASMMLVPALSALAAVRSVRRPASVRRALDLVLPQPFDRLVSSGLLALAVPLALQPSTAGRIGPSWAASSPP